MSKEATREKRYFFSSDYHFDHENVIKYDNRPFKTVNQMNEALIANHNSVVSDDDDFYFLGDFAFANAGKIDQWLSRLNGNMYFIKGNHDKKETTALYKAHGTYLGQLEEINIAGQRIVLCHYGMRVWNRSHKGSWHLYGHSHGSLEHTVWGKSMDVGIMMSGYIPLEFMEIKKVMDKREILMPDHHGKREDDKAHANANS